MEGDFLEASSLVLFLSPSPYILSGMRGTALPHHRLPLFMVLSLSRWDKQPWTETMSQNKYCCCFRRVFLLPRHQSNGHAETPS